MGLSDHAYILLNNNCPEVSTEITGPPSVIPNSLYVYKNTTGGEWGVGNTFSNAFIVGSSSGDSVVVNSGSAIGSFRVTVSITDDCGGSGTGLANVYVRECSVTGNIRTGTGQMQVYRSQYDSLSHWRLFSSSGQATIVGSITNDSVVIYTGETSDHLLLDYISSNGSSCGLDIFVDGPLPVELASFTSDVSGINVTLNWSTASEENNKGFDVERKLPTNEEWIYAGYVNGNGTVNTTSNYSFADRNLSTGTYKYRLKQTDYNGNYKYYELANEVVIGIPEKYSMSQNYPNPFNPTTSINYAIPEPGNVSLKIFDIT